jgi:WD40 repeat protein
MLATGAPDGSIRVWAPDPDLPVRRIGSVGRFEFAGYASSAHLGVFGNASEHVVVTDDGGREVRRLEPHGEGPFAVARDGNLAFWRDGTLYVQSARTGRVASARDAPAADPPELVALSDDGRVAAMAVAGGELTVFSPGSGGRTASFAVEEGGSPLTSLAVSSDGRLVAVASAGAVTIFRTRDLRVVREEPGSAVSFAPVGGLVAIVRPDVSIAVLRDDDWQEHAVIRGTPSGESYLAFSPDARLLATTGFDGVLRLWDTADGVLVRTRHLFEAPPVSDSTLATSPPVLTSAGFAMAGALLEGLAAYDVCDHCLDADALLAQARERLRDVRPSTGG